MSATTIRRNQRAYDLANLRERLLMQFAQSVTLVRHHLGTVKHRVVTTASMVAYHLEAARREAKTARLLWSLLEQGGFGKEAAV